MRVSSIKSFESFFAKNEMECFKKGFGRGSEDPIVNGKPREKAYSGEPV